MALSDSELRRYARHLLLPEVGPSGQEKLSAARVLIVGAGGLGSPLALYLAAAGVGHLGVVEDDVVDASNLQRQILYDTRDVGQPKLEAATDRLRSLNPDVRVTPHPVRLSRENAMAIVAGYDLVADGTDNFQTRYLVNDAAYLSRIPNVHASVFRFEGQVSVFGAPDGPCYRCLYPDPPPPGLVPSCAEGGVLGVLPGTVGTLQATEVLKWILGIGEPLVGRLMLYDALSSRMDTVEVPKDPSCPLCGEAPTITALQDYEALCRIEAVPFISVAELRARLQSDSPPLLLDVRQPAEAAIATLGGTLIPLAELAARLNALDPARETVVYCRTGVRSAEAVKMLRSNGFGNAVNLAGGIRAWSLEIDPAVSVY